MEAKLIAITIETLRITFFVSMPLLLAGLVAGLVISIFQATTQINEATLSFLPKVVLTGVVMIFTMPWMINMMIDFTTKIFKMIPTFAF
ncbi:MAG TPA: flagellar biosynthesis protein FliQ [Campylobacterales bacterium]|nr:flagellar biosynthesis protein FliQ [Campylobacterales bacterium]